MTFPVCMNFRSATVRNRPDVRIAERQLHAQNALVGKAIADLYPNVSFSGFWAGSRWRYPA